jgi:PKD repeat protein
MTRIPQITLKFEFTDLSAYEVEEWSWDFGDPKSISNTSNAKNPMHKFSEKGVYEVCLIVKNRNGMDTLCRTVKLGVMVNTEDEKEIPEIQIWPNPCDDYVIINVMDYNPQKMTLKLYDLLGMPIELKLLYQGSNYINLKNLPTGVYFVQVAEGGKIVSSKRLLKL